MFGPPEYEPNFDLLTSGYEHALRTMDKYRIYDEALWDPPACKPLIIENQFFLALQYGKAHEAAYLLDVQPCDYTFTVLPPEFCTCRDAGDFELFWGPAPDYVEDIHAWFRQNPWDVDEDFIISQVRVWCPHGGRENFRAYVDTDKSSPMTIDKYNVVYTYRVVVGPAWTTTSSMAGPTSFGGSYHHCEVKIIARPFNGEPPGECCPLEISSEWNYGPVFRTADPYTGTYDFTWPTEADAAAAAGIGGLNTDPECKYCASEINGNRAGKTETLSPGAYQIAFIVYPCKDKSWEQSECPVGIWMIVVIEDPDPDDCCPIGIEDVTTYYTSDDTSDPNGYGEDDRVYHTFMTNAAVAANAIHIGVPFNPNCEYIAYS